MVMALAFHTEDPDGVGYAFNIFLFLDLYPSVVRTGPPHTEMGRNIWGRDPDLLFRHKSDYGETKGCPHRGLGRSSLPVIGTGHVLHGVPG